MRLPARPVQRGHSARTVALMPAATEANALLALMLLHDARRQTPASADGDIVLLEDQDRESWDRAEIDEGLLRVEAALQAGGAGPYAIQAAIAALHARARIASDTDWRQIEALYALLLQRAPSAVVELNHAVAVAMVEGPNVGFSSPTRSTRAASCAAITCCTPFARIYFGDSAALRRRRPRTRRRSSSYRWSPSAASFKEDSSNYDRSTQVQRRLNRELDDVAPARAERTNSRLTTPVARDSEQV